MKAIAQTLSSPRMPVAQMLAWTAGIAMLMGTTAARAQTSPTLIAQAATLEASSAQNGTLYLNEDRNYSYNLELERAATVNGVYLPVGTIIQGRYEPAGEDGLRYIADTAIVGDQAYSLQATSRVLDDQKDPRDTSAGSIGEDAAIGAAGGAVLGELLGDIDLGEVIGGAAAGAAVGNLTADQVVVIEPDQLIVLDVQ
ncbi:hypothetical protein IQ241_02005 [Romeria aff. gracilis LEGE 07310]|uniref:Glycine zipper 2TM domain-containing protein n=1 Tax=Vasconcelosia minhoensis LEGE 07310 TaxID=915328 RepID=A0A8J7AV49_9CYAN|nr:hypothetical protein [Romeria gracilis]MBE9076077.1 hypothetical protein [Romeria aff. gracilis LEGE 07310]